MDSEGDESLGGWSGLVAGPSTPLVRPRALARSISDVVELGALPAPIPAGSSSDPASGALSDAPAKLPPARWALLRDCYRAVVHNFLEAPWTGVYVCAAAGTGGRACPRGFIGNMAGLARIARTEDRLGLWKGALALVIIDLAEIAVGYLLWRWASRPQSESDSTTDHLQRLDRVYFLRAVLNFLLIVLKHILQLIAFRMMFYNTPENQTITSVVRHLLSTRGFAGLLRGLPLTLLQAYFKYPLPLEALRIRQMIADGPARGTIADLSFVLKNDGWTGFFAGWRSWLFSLPPHIVTALVFELLTMYARQLVDRARPSRS
jgi:hypothetical protein